MNTKLFKKPATDVKKVRRYPEDGTLLTTGARLHFIDVQEMHAGITTVVARRYVADDGILILASLDRSPHGALLHVSLSRADRLPSWEEVKAIRSAFYPPDIDVMMVLPAEADYINVHQYCFHLWQTPKVWGIQ